eukprot:TRINITY_DN9158_c0_g1_i1.p1 TRINITY_DN9158_c0_g1~~TRINITY_DN9158_c0_g1_i1.p1  ORF type:complete len:374 (-),score=57.34 TRINITY_DN9158_c0_g1_i1:280-1338(-)
MSEGQAGDEAGLRGVAVETDTIEHKWELLPAFLRVKGLVKQHLDSFNYFINDEIKKIVQAESNFKITIDSDPNFYLKFLDVHVGSPQLDESFVSRSVTPQECRLRDLTYSAPIMVDVEYTRGKEIVEQRGKHGNGAVLIGRLPIMLRSDRCVLKGRTEEQMASLGECPLDPGGYFVCKGVERVVQIQEQLSKNRIMVDVDSQGEVKSSITSSTPDRKSKTDIVIRKGVWCLKSSSFSEEVNVACVLKAMGVESDQEIVCLVGSEEIVSATLSATVEHCKSLGVFTQVQALDYLGSKVKSLRFLNRDAVPFSSNAQKKASKVDDARDAQKTSCSATFLAIGTTLVKKSLQWVQ